MSTVLTWAATPKLPDDAPFTEAMYKRRRAAPAFADVKVLESHVMALARDGVRAHVLAAGVLYGLGESVLHPLFKVRGGCCCRAAVACGHAA